ncbi:matrix metallo ase-11 [Fusarium denticulatum]|uniref:Matrix metallo ase-11 n=1 Tax=Fusarium denticulatum TaxID=48507 RepID=A0A8H5UGV0_9HYPO|nr:matrix metallo ase-11 [Fusarium denticulatum]
MASEGPSTKEILLDAVEQTIGADLLQTIQPTDVSNVDEDVKGPKITEAPVCSTQLPVPPVFQAAMERKNGLWDIVVGLKEHIPRWVPGSVIKWAAWRAGFKSQDDADYAAQQLNIAAQKWNEANVGVTFEWVPMAKDATFVLTNGGANGTTLARAFFPNGEDLNYVFVYSYAFSQEWKPHMWNVFMHELGHVIGLRHEFAIDDVRDKMTADREGERAVRIGAPDPKSVMNYRNEPPQLQQSDIDSTRQFYAMTEDANGKNPMIGMTQVIDYTPL